MKEVKCISYFCYSWRQWIGLDIDTRSRWWGRHTCRPVDMGPTYIRWPLQQPNASSIKISVKNSYASSSPLLDEHPCSNCRATTWIFCSALKMAVVSRNNCTFYTGCFKKSSPLNLFGIFSIWLSFFCVKCCIFIGNSYPHITTSFCRFILIFHQMTLIFPQVPIVFTLSSFEYSDIKCECRGRSPTAWFMQNGWSSVVDSTADFLNSAQLPPFVKVTGND